MWTKPEQYDQMFYTYSHRKSVEPIMKRVQKYGEKQWSLLFSFIGTYLLTVSARQVRHRLLPFDIVKSKVVAVAVAVV